MVAALVGDLGRLPHVDLHWMCDQRVAGESFGRGTVHFVSQAEEEAISFQRLAAQSDWTLVIAPEFDGHLVRRCELVERVGGRLLGPSLIAVRLAADKQKTIECLAKCGVATPHGRPIHPGTAIPPDFGFPAVLKPIDGAGSIGMIWIESAEHAASVTVNRCTRRLERYCPGMAASVAFLCAKTHFIDLPPCRQLIDRKAGFAYRGGQWPLEPALARRASTLAHRAVACLPPLLGYLGVDLILGTSPDGADDVVIEINPRLTTSYVGLRALSEQNLAEAILDVAMGSAVRLSFCRESLLLWADGEVQRGA